jgi:hypothetical protein
VVLDTAGIAISQAAYFQGIPALAFDGANFLVVWMDLRSGTGLDIYGARVTQAGVVLDPTGIVISTAVNYQADPAIAFDGANFLVVWTDYRNNPDTSDIYGARVSTGGVVFDSGPVVRQEGNQYSPALARGTGSQLFLVYQGWAGTVGGKTYNVSRIWGKMDPHPGIEDTMNDERGALNLGATIVRGVLFLGDCPRTGTVPKTVLLDISGRKVADLRPGANDVSWLSPGVYFVRERHAQAQAQAVRKVIVTR